MTGIHPIEIESYRILAERIDLSDRPPGVRAVVERVIHASADLEYATSMVVDEAAVAAGVAAIRAGAPVITDVEMTGSGITGVPTECFLAGAVGDPPTGLTRTAAGMRLAAAAHPTGSIVVVGCAPTALVEVLALFETRVFTPAVVIGLPVGFVGAAESKEAAREASARAAGQLPVITNIGEKGGSAVAAAAVNALVRIARA
jgi:precorrin-8X/cobalt-precorrin-8 methylmutase